MPRADNEPTLKPSLLDRLIDPDSAGTIARRGYSIEQAIDSVQRDLEDLLNTRQTNLTVPEEFEQLRTSIAVYGLPDINSLSAITPQNREDIGHLLEGVI